MGNVTVNKAMAEVGTNAQARVNIKNSCNKVVPRAAKYGSCNFYYRPYGMDPIGPTSIYKLKFSNVLMYSAALYANPSASDSVYKNAVVGEKLLDIKDMEWSRWHDFKSRHRNCGHEPPPYYINYGYYYCSRYGADLYPNLESEAGRKWLIKGRELLQIYLDDALQQNMKGNGVIVVRSKKYPNKFLPEPINVGLRNIELMPDQFKKMAFLTHVPAYVDANLASVSYGDLFRITKGPTLDEWLDPDTYSQAVDAGQIVLGDWFGPAVNALGDARDLIVRSVKDPDIALKKLNELYDSTAKTYDKYVNGAKNNIKKTLEHIRKWSPW